MSDSEACVTPLADLRASALRHYDELATKACEWSSVVPRAINFYYDAEEAKASALVPDPARPTIIQCPACWGTGSFVSIPAPPPPTGRP